MTALYDLPAPAKINLFLHVTGRRADGYHLLQTVFRFIDLHDTLHVERRADGAIVRAAGSNDTVPAESDLVVRAARALQAATGTSFGADIRYQKRIPAGAGLGGGSSDAATTLLALNRLWGTGLRRDALMRLGATLGADVPVFIFGQAAFGEGVGDVLHALPVPLPPRAYLVACPAEPVPTGPVFQDEHLTRDTKPVRIADFCSTLHQSVASNTGNTDCGVFFGRNDLEDVVFRRHPPVAQLARQLQQCGWQSRMSGAGGSCFVEFSTLHQAQLAQHQFLVKMAPSGSGASASPSVWSCIGLEAHPLRDWVDS